MEHIVGGDRCREFFGAERGWCDQPATDGLCPEHAEQRRAWEARMQEAADVPLSKSWTADRKVDQVT